jgi:glycine dehydrogenase
LAGFSIITIKTDEKTGKVDLEDLREKAVKNKDTLGAFMITYPSTFGIYEETIREAISIIH